MTVMFLMDRLNIHNSYRYRNQEAANIRDTVLYVCMYPESTTRHTSIEALLQAKLNLSESAAINTNILVLVLVSI